MKQIFKIFGTIAIVTSFTTMLLGCEQANSCKYDETTNTLACAEKNYKILNIGGKTWMAENLVRHDITGNSFCYGDIPSNCDKYGSLYPYETAMKICPEGWELPTQADFENANVLSDSFNAQKVGFRYYDGKYADENISARFWTRDSFDDARAVMISLDSIINIEHFNKSIGASVRCIKK